MEKIVWILHIYRPFKWGRASNKRKKAINQIFNLTFGKASKINYLAELVKSYFPKVKIKYEKRDKLMLKSTLDITKAKKILSYSPEKTKLV